MSSEPEITTMGKKGQIVIPKTIRDQLALGPQSKFVVYSSGDMIVMKKLKIPDVRKEFEAIFREMDRKNLGLSEEDILEEIQAMRKEKREHAKNERKGRR